MMLNCSENRSSSARDEPTPMGYCNAVMTKRNGTLNSPPQIWVNDLQLRLATLSNQGRRLMVLNSGHDMPTDLPDAIVTAVRELCAPQNQP